MASIEDVIRAKRLRAVTSWLLVAVAVVLVAWDVRVYDNGLEGDTISEVVRDVSHRWWVVPFVLMSVMGHFFWNRPEASVQTKWINLIAATSAVLVRDLVNMGYPLPVPPFDTLIVAVAGFIVGAVWWPQTSPDNNAREV